MLHPNATSLAAAVGRLSSNSRGSSSWKNECEEEEEQHNEGERGNGGGGRRRKMMNQQYQNYAERKRRAPKMDLSEFTLEEQMEWKKARARQYSAMARQRQVEKENQLREKVNTLSMFKVLVTAAPDAILLLSPDVSARILFVNDRCNQLLKLPLRGGKEQPLAGRCLWEWMDEMDTGAVVAAVGKCMSSNDNTMFVQVKIRTPPLPLTVDGAVEQQQQEHQQERSTRVDLTLRSSELGLVLFLRPEGREGYGGK